jgi:large subunit ribosomal protein L13e
VQERKFEACVRKAREQRKSDLVNAEALKEVSRIHHVKPTIFKSDGRQRSGRGFSLEEFNKAGILPEKARRLKLPFDKRRKTAHDQNVEAIKTYMKKADVKPKQKTKLQLKKKAKK